MELRGLEQIDLVGHSLGGMVALKVAADYPARVRHLVLLSTPVLPPQKVLKQQRRLLRLMPASSFVDLPKEMVLSALDALAAADISTDLSRVCAPTLAVVAAEDSLNLAAAQLLADQIGAQIYQVAGKAEEILTDQAVVVAGLIEAFCTDCWPEIS
jgi:pimeloyl-ACP methyl ester carboxylesterase